MLKNFRLMIIAFLVLLLNSPILIYAIGSKAVITTIAGDGTPTYGGDNGPATAAQLNSPTEVMFNGVGNLYVADAGNHRIRKVVSATGIITTVAGDGTGAYGGDGEMAITAQLNSPRSVAFDEMDNLYIADTNNHRIRKVVSATGVITTVAGIGTFGFSGDGGPATAAQLSFPTGVAFDEAGNLYIADLDDNRVRKVIVATGVITTVAGIGTFGFSGDGGPATAAQLSGPAGVVVDEVDNLYIADQQNNRIRKVIAATGVITTVAGIGTLGFSGDGGPATAAQLHFPTDLAFDKSGNLYIADLGNNRIRKVIAATGVITTVAGIGTLGFSGDGGPATAAQLNFPAGVAFDGIDNLYIADTSNHRVRKVEEPKIYLPIIFKN
ncbi:MAG: NHL repeat-containing protein [Anaerolineae bacterium]|nr:NHL repeat-containing protein [Anaerolineae bacterium]